MKITDTEIAQSIANLKRAHKNNWISFWDKLNAIIPQINARNSEEDITEYITSEDFVAIGYTPSEAAAFMFVFTEDCMGQPVTNLELVERWFCYCA
jgi:hypothetical protein